MRQSEKRRFAMHPHLLLDVIKRQAGTLGKSILELAMNAVDAKATRCDIVLGLEELTVTDNGHGFRGREEIEAFFEVFGQPQTEDKIYGTFRMGRGQAFSFGVNLWESGKYQMLVDVKEQGLDYHLTELKKAVRGCAISIQLYEPITNVQQDDTIREVKKLCRWMGVHSIKIYLNGEMISLDPEEQEKDFWTEETDKCWVRFGGSYGMSVYNMGAYVKDFHDWEFGKSGEAVSKVGMKVNFARNDVMSDCPVWRELKGFVREKSDQDIKRKKSLDDAGRARYARELATGQSRLDDVVGMKLLTDVTGRHWSIQQLRTLSYKYNGKITVAPQGDRLGDRLQQARTCFVLGTNTLLRFNVRTVDELFAIIKGNDPKAHAWSQYWKVVDFAKLTAKWDKKCTIFAKGDWSPKEQLITDLIDNIGSFGRSWRDNPSRKSMIGESPGWRAWTDGSSYVVYSRKWLKTLNLASIYDLHSLAHVVLHEYCHHESDEATHIHGAEFYQEYHDHEAELAWWLNQAIDRIPKMVKNREKKMSRSHLCTQDRLLRLSRSQDSEVLSADTKGTGSKGVRRRHGNVG